MSNYSDQSELSDSHWEDSELAASQNASDNLSAAAALERIQDGIVALDLEWRFTYLNDAAARILGLDAGQAIGRSIRSEVGEAENISLYRTCLAAIAQQEPMREVQYSKTSDRWYEYQLYPSDTGLSVLIRDITDLKRSEESSAYHAGLLVATTANAADALITLDSSGRLTFMNPAAERLIGWTQVELIGKVMHNISHYIRPDHSPFPFSECPLVQGMLAGRTMHGHEDVFIRKDGSFVPVNCSLSPIYSDETLAGAVLVVQDITASKQAEEEAKRAEKRLQFALESGKLGMYHRNLVTGEFLDVSAQFKSHFGFEADAEVRHKDAVSRVHPDDLSHTSTAVPQAVKDQRQFAIEFRTVGPGNIVRWIASYGMPVFDTQGKAVEIIGVTQEITERKRLAEERELARREADELSDRDPLTGLLNHRAFQDWLGEAVARFRENGGVSAVVILDIDNFTFFNDYYGHLVGDQVLCGVVERLLDICGDADLIARFGGDEFAVLLTNTSGATIGEIETRLINGMMGMSYSPSDGSTNVPITLSAGGALISADSVNLHEVISSARERLERSKTGGDVEAEAQRIRSEVRRQIAGFSLLDSLVTAVNNKDRYTSRHSDDVMSYCLMIARELGLDEATQRSIAIAALLHDVGKIGVPDSILRKPAQLSAEEFEAIKNHPQMGTIIVSAIPGMEGTLDAVQHHHERWDGSGYPFGLRGEEIPLIARLMAVADAYSAMTSDRPYRQGMDSEKAMAILAEGAGKQWDPQCVSAFERAQKREQPA